jgi:hypothetical protein
MAIDGIVYKYVGKGGALAILRNCTLRFAKPSTMNDPFDVLVNDLFEKTFADLTVEHNEGFLDQLIADPVEFSRFIDRPENEIKEFADQMAALPSHIRKAFAEFFGLDLFVQHDAELKNIYEELEQQRLKQIEEFRNTALFCATRTNDNLLMWAHYAEQHTGAVLGFKPDLERDSFFRVMEDVKYTNERPKFYSNLKTIGPQKPEIPLEEIRALRESHFYSKGLDWAYEKELRLVIPGEITDGKTEKFFKFYPHELSELIFGVRAGNDFMKMAADAAKKLNPDVAIYHAALHQDNYSLLIRACDEQGPNS